MVLIVKNFCLIDEIPKEEEDEAEEPESSSQELGWFVWTRVWMEKGGSSTLEEGDCQSLPVQVFIESPVVHVACHLPYLSFAYSLTQLLNLLQVLHQMCQTSYLWQEAECLEAKVLQKIVCSGRVQG